MAAKIPVKKNIITSDNSEKKNAKIAVKNNGKNNAKTSEKLEKKNAKKDAGTSDKSKEESVIKYESPNSFLIYQETPELMQLLGETHQAIKNLSVQPFGKEWLADFMQTQLNREATGSSKIEGANFHGSDLNNVLEKKTPEENYSHSQRQVAAAQNAYKWIEETEGKLSLEEAALKLHRLIVEGCDDDHCAPAKLRGSDINVTFGIPLHRGAVGGKELEQQFSKLFKDMESTYAGSNPLLKAIALHYHIASIHPFADGNGRLARCLEALILKRADYLLHGFIALANYYYENKTDYLTKLANTREQEADLTGFFIFCLTGIKKHCELLLDEMITQNRVALFKDMMNSVARYRLPLPERQMSLLGHSSFPRRQSSLSERQMYLLGHSSFPRSQFLSERQMYLLEHLLKKEAEPQQLLKVWDDVLITYKYLNGYVSDFFRDINRLISLRAINYKNYDDSYQISINLAWPQVMTKKELGQAILKAPTISDRLLKP